MPRKKGSSLPLVSLVCLGFILLFSVLCPRSASGQSDARDSANSAASSSANRAAIPAAEQKVSAYTLSPDLYRQAKALSRTNFRLDLIDPLYSIVLLLLILALKLAPLYRTWAERAARNRFLQALIFLPLLIVTMAVLHLPVDLYGHSLLRRYGLSIENWGPWTVDWLKGIVVLSVIAIPVVWILYAVIRRSPRRWWFYFWLISIPLMLLLTFVEPFVIEPVFFHFAPLEQKDARLVTEIENIVHRAGLNIPASHIFWMRASDKTPTMNAYVSGLGASKRIVIWDTTIAKESSDEIATVVGHEMGHYVLGHVWKGTVLSAAGLLILLFIGFHGVSWLLRRYGESWRVTAVGDWASLPALLLLFAIFGFISDPVNNAVSRHFEHQADVYGLEVTHGVIPDAGQAAADSFEVEGKTYLADPDPNPVQVFLFYDHPPIADRIKLCLTYDPWARGEKPQFVK